MIHFLKKVLYPLFEFIKSKQYRKYLRLVFFSKKINKIYGKDFETNNIKSFLNQYYMIFYKESYFFNTSDTPLIIDCGANIGLSNLYFSKLHPNSKIISFEADPAIYEICKKNLISQNITNVELINEAVSISNSYQSFYSKTGDDGSLSEIIGATSIDVKTKRLRDVLANQKKVHYLKIDIEGAETEVILDIKDQLMKVENLFIDFHSMINLQKQSLAKILSCLEELNFWYRITPEYELKGSERKHWNQTYLSYSIIARKNIV